MTDFLANMEHDHPRRGQRKRVVFYRQGLKIYGLLPHLLAKRLRAEFRSNQMRLHGFPWSGGTILAPTGEDNYTVVGYSQSSAAQVALLDWLYADAGFEWAIAADFEATDLLAPNMWRMRPTVWHPAPTGEARSGFAAVLAPPSGPDLTVLGRLLPPGGA